MNNNNSKEKANNHYKTLEKNFLKRLKAGYPTKYDSNKHPKLLLKVFHNCGSIDDFCAEALISRETYYNWRDANEEFRKAIGLVLPIGASLWDKKGLNDKTINYQVWERIKRRYEKGATTVQFKDTTPINIIDAALKGFERGELTAQETVNFSSVATAKNNIIEGLPVETNNKRLTAREMELERERALEEKKLQLEALNARITGLESKITNNEAI